MGLFEAWHKEPHLVWHVLQAADLLQLRLVWLHPVHQMLHLVSLLVWESRPLLAQCVVLLLAHRVPQLLAHRMRRYIHYPSVSSGVEVLEQLKG